MSNMSTIKAKEFLERHNCGICVYKHKCLEVFMDNEILRCRVVDFAAIDNMLDDMETYSNETRTIFDECFTIKARWILHLLFKILVSHTQIWLVLLQTKMESLRESFYTKKSRVTEAIMETLIPKRRRKRQYGMAMDVILLIGFAIMIFVLGMVFGLSQAQNLIWPCG